MLETHKRKAIDVKSSVAQIIGSIIRNTINIGYIFAYRYRVSTMTEKAADTDICIHSHVHMHHMMFTNAKSCIALNQNVDDIAA